jgi:hypothetical protein
VTLGAELDGGAAFDAIAVAARPSDQQLGRLAPALKTGGHLPGPADLGLCPRERMFADQIVQRREWYWNLWSRRAELNEALMARVPGLREMVAAGAG